MHDALQRALVVLLAGHAVFTLALIAVIVLLIVHTFTSTRRGDILIGVAALIVLLALVFL